MALFFSVLCLIVVISLSSAESNSTLGESKHAPSNKKSASPQLNMSPFLFYLYNALSSEKIFDKVFDVNFSPKDVGPAFYKNSVYFARQLGLRQPDPFSSKIAAAAIKAFKTITPLEFFKVWGNTIETFFSVSGFGKELDQQTVIQNFVKNLKEALKIVGGSGAKAANVALVVGSANTFKDLGKLKPNQVKFILLTFAKEMQKVR